MVVAETTNKSICKICGKEIHGKNLSRVNRNLVRHIFRVHKISKETYFKKWTKIP